MKQTVEEEQGRRRKAHVYKELGITPDGLARDIRSLKDWLIKQPHLPHIVPENTDINEDDFLENFIIASKNSVERAKDVIDTFFAGKSFLPEIYSGRDPLLPQFKDSVEAMSLGMVPEYTSEGRRVFVMSHNYPSADKFDPVFMVKRISMMLDVAFLEGIDYIGLEVVVNNQNVVFSQLTKYNPSFTKKVFDLLSKSLPQRLRRIHIVHPSSAHEAGLALFKPLMSKKLGDRIAVHHSPKELVKVLGPKCVPSDFGGDAPSIDSINRYWHQKLIDYRDIIMLNDKITTDETKRVGKSRYAHNEGIFGNDGSFRKIEVD